MHCLDFCYAYDVIYIYIHLFEHKWDMSSLLFHLVRTFVFTEKKGREKEKQKSTKNPNIRAPDSKPSNIKSMFAAAAVKPKKKVEVTFRINCSLN